MKLGKKWEKLFNSLLINQILIYSACFDEETIKNNQCVLEAKSRMPAADITKYSIVFERNCDTAAYIKQRMVIDNAEIEFNTRIDEKEERKRLRERKVKRKREREGVEE